MNKRVLVFGSFVTDLCSRTSSLPHAGETVKGNCFRMGPGGKGSNQAIAAHRAGAEVSFITKLGDDLLGRQAMNFYRTEGLPTDGIIEEVGAQTGAALILVDEGSAQNQIVVVSGACGDITSADTDDAMLRLEQSGILLTQLETNLEPVCALLKRAKELGVLTILNPAPARRMQESVLRCVDIITPNESEAQLLTGIEVADEQGVRRAAHALLDAGVGKVIITLGRNGCYAHDGAEERFLDAVTCGPAVDTTGAGDAFNGGLAAALSRGMDFFDAAFYGSVVAGLAVTRHGTAPAMPYRQEVEEVCAALTCKR